MNTLGRSRALVIDDQAMVALEIEDILSEHGFEVISVNTRAVLDQALATGPFAVIITDTDLAAFDEMRSWDAASIIICSGRSRDVLEEEFPGMPIVGKPFVAEDLLSLLPVR